MVWHIDFFSDDVREALYDLPIDMRAMFERISRMIEANGMAGMRAPYVTHLEGPIWEMRLRGKDGIARAAYITVREQRVVVVHVFRKKTQKTHRRDIELALKRAKDFR